MGKHEAEQSLAQNNAEEWARTELLRRDWREAKTNSQPLECDGKVMIFEPKDYDYDMNVLVPAADQYKGTGRHSAFVVRAFCTGCGSTWADWDDSDFNVWGTKKSDINADEFCVECEREVPYHYENCPLHRSNKGE